MIIDYSSFESAVEQLEKSMSFYHSPMAAENKDLKEQFRAATIQAFEFTYELAYKMIRRQLAQIVANPAELSEMSFMDLMRTAQEAGLVRDAVAYRVYREKRNITTHTYDAEKANAILSLVDSFLGDMHHVLDELRRRNGGGNDDH